RALSLRSVGASSVLHSFPTRRSSDLEACAGRTRRQLHLRKVDRAEGRADVGIVDQLARDLATDPVLRLLRGAADMRGQDHVRQRSEEHTSELQSRFDLVCRLLLE